MQLENFVVLGTIPFDLPPGELKAACAAIDRKAAEVRKSWSKPRKPRRGKIQLPASERSECGLPGRAMPRQRAAA